jgi:hypothetical protein
MEELFLNSSSLVVLNLLEHELLNEIFLVNLTRALMKVLPALLDDEFFLNTVLSTGTHQIKRQNGLFVFVFKLLEFKIE